LSREIELDMHDSRRSASRSADGSRTAFGQPS
jgi:hypothetical protein